VSLFADYFLLSGWPAGAPVAGPGETLAPVGGAITAGPGEVLVNCSTGITAGAGETLADAGCGCANLCPACPTMPPSSLCVVFFGGDCGLGGTLVEGPVGVWLLSVSVPAGLPYYDEIRYQFSCVTVGGSPGYRVAAVYYLTGFPAGWSAGGDVVPPGLTGHSTCDPFYLLFSAVDSQAWSALGWGTAHDPCTTPPTSATVSGGPCGGFGARPAVQPAERVSLALARPVRCRSLLGREEFRSGCGGLSCRHGCKLGLPAVPALYCQVCPSYEPERYEDADEFPELPAGPGWLDG
jgi:hypothetical protein